MEANEFSLEKMLMARAAQQYRPINGSIELLPLCNMNCRMCYVRLSRQEMDQMGSLHPLEDWMRITEEMQKAGVVFMLLTGGEPLLYPGFRELYLKLQAMRSGQPSLARIVPAGSTSRCMGPAKRPIRSSAALRAMKRPCGPSSCFARTGWM